MGSSEKCSKRRSPAGPGSIWSLATSITLAAGLVCVWREDGALNLFGSWLLISLVTVAFVTSIARALEYAFRWRLVVWPATCCLALVSVAGLVREMGPEMLVLVGLLATTSPWLVATVTARVPIATKGLKRRAQLPATEARIHLNQSEVDQRFDDIVSRL